MKVQLTKTGKAALVAAALITGAPAIAASPGTATTTTTTSRQAESENEFPWGLLGLLGLAGLLGLKRKERDIHVDARRGPDGR